MSEQMEQELALCNVFIRNHTSEALQILENLSPPATAEFLNTVSGPAAAALVKGMNPVAAAEVLSALAPTQKEAVCRELETEIVSTLLRRLDPKKRRAILEALTGELSRELERVLAYGKNTAGALMKTNILVLTTDTPVKDALDHLARRPDQIFEYIYVLDRKQLLLGFLKVRDLFLAASERRVSDVMRPAGERLRPETGFGEMLDHPAWARLHALPVVSEEGVFMGAVSRMAIQKMESQMTQSLPAPRAQDAGKALGELYWLGVSAFLRGAAAAVEGEETAEQQFCRGGES